MKQDYFKGFKVFKIIQLVILIIFSCTFFLLIYFDERLREYIFVNKNIMTLCVFLWAFMIYNVVCIVLDFYQLEGHIAHDNVLNRAVYMDSLTGIPNRFGCDKVFEEYSGDKDISSIGCALVSISNLDEVNKNKGRLLGNIILVNFSKIIEKVGDQYGFVGRNNGNGFLVVIDNCDEEKINDFSRNLEREVQNYNQQDENEKIDLSIVSLLNQDVKEKDFTELVVKLYSKARG